MKMQVENIKKPPEILGEIFQVSGELIKDF